MDDPTPMRLNSSSLVKLQQRVSQIQHPWFKSLHAVEGLPRGFRPWTSGLSPSALYACSLKCRKAMGIKTPEVKWMNIKRWVTTTPVGVQLPSGIYFSIKRHEKYVGHPEPHFQKTQFILLMFPYGNVWSQIASPEKDEFFPITEEWMWADQDEALILERLLRRDAALPVKGYFKMVYRYMTNHPEQIGIHLKRKKKS